MAASTSIQWTHSTFNAWIGCTRVSAGCARCYAEHGMGPRLGVRWGDDQPRRRTSRQTWDSARGWNRKAKASGIPHRVFTASLADILDPQAPAIWLGEFFALVQQTPALDWLLLTKRPHLFADRLQAAAEALGADHPTTAWIREWLLGNPPVQVQFGTSVENQTAADRRIPELLQIPAQTRFLSCEPLLGPVILPAASLGNGIDWVIVGGESSKRRVKARPMHPDWARSLRDQCGGRAAFFFKQWGEWMSVSGSQIQVPVTRKPVVWATWDGDQAVEVQGGPAPELVRRLVGTKNAGRVLDGRTWDEVPPSPIR